MEFFVFLGALIVYLLPSVIASHRNHRSKNAIFLLNLIFGWTVLGWFIALIWCATGNVEPPAAKPTA